MKENINGLALFAGAGGLELGLKLALGDRYKCVAYVERSTEASAVLAKNMEQGRLDKAVIWDDVTTFTGDVISPLVDRIDIVSAGFPCQPWSYAGSRRKTDDDRWLWGDIFRLVREIRPRSIFLENVPGLLHGGIEHVLGDLASVGFDAEWISVRAADVGAPHKRERVFILAHSTSRGSEGSGLPVRSGRPQQAEADVDRRGAELGITLAHSQRERGRGWHTGGEYAEHAFPPGPTASTEWRDILSDRPDLAPATVKSEIRGVVDGVSRGMDFTRASQLRILGNAVVPGQAAEAYKILSSRMNK